jgi:hypothetical protein
VPLSRIGAVTRMRATSCWTTWRRTQVGKQCPMTCFVAIVVRLIVEWIKG